MLITPGPRYSSEEDGRRLKLLRWSLRVALTERRARRRDQHILGSRLVASIHFDPLEISLDLTTS